MIKQSKFIVIFCIVIIVCAWMIYPSQKVIIISDLKNQSHLAYAKVEDGQEFSLSFVHSVNKRPVDEYFVVENNDLVVMKTVYDSFGAGMPEGTVAGMEPHLNNEGLLEISSIDYRLPEINLFVGTVAKHTLSINNRKIALADLAEPGKPVQLKLSYVSVVQLWKGRCL